MKLSFFLFFGVNGDPMVSFFFFFLGEITDNKTTLPTPRGEGGEHQRRELRKYFRPRGVFLLGCYSGFGRKKGYTKMVDWLAMREDRRRMMG